MPGDHVFLSYISEDSAVIDELQSALEAAEFVVWRDKDKLWPGDDWQNEIRNAIRGGSFVFLACFSSNLAKREKSYQFEELTLAAEEYRLRAPDAKWLMTARLDECEIPEFDLGAGRTLDRTIHRTDLFGPQKSANVARLVVAIQRAMGSTPGTPPASVSKVAADAGRAKNDDVEHLRDLLRNPSLVMDYDEYLSGLRVPIRETLANRDEFPMSVASGTKVDPDLARSWMGRLRRYDDVMAPALIPLKLIAMYGTPTHEQELTKTLQVLAQESTQREGMDILTSLHEYPALLATYATALGATTKLNYSMLRAATADVRVSSLGRPRVPFILTSGGRSIVEHDRWSAFGTLICLEDDGNEIQDDEIDKLLKSGGGRRFTPVSDHLFTLLAPLYRPQFASDDEYAEGFDRVEVLLDAISEDARAQEDQYYYGAHGGYGRYTWRGKHRYRGTGAEMELLMEAQSHGAGWTPLLGGLFGGDSERAISALTAVKDLATSIRSSHW
ncbi:toll/interleukin-1 receptor domain-containing protein [Galactobacter valiniphilus]|uniref:Toll/interleukin-1 receptor domain-containing protein n=1 Tax=Galactobacter valiniphilus TaxID=2676122 RepID=A0A399J771_9MICC|nr:toll/interleukin-1 receptor domain-containing protein [Galactobacter valiniphilus]RII41321.1 toll/interleukin-1 receptor domain-containing protein [Galactobacter valiniphilus]